MFSASSFSKITTMTWSGVGTPGRPATDGTADADDVREDDPVAVVCPLLDVHPLSTARATAAATHARTFTRASVPLGTDGKGRRPRGRCAGVSSASGDRVVDVVVIGAGQAGLSTAWALARQGFEPATDFVVLDADDGPGGAWQHRWPSLTVGATHRVHDLPGLPFRPESDSRRAAEVVPAYFAEYERAFDLPIHRPVRVTSVSRTDDDRFLVRTDAGDWTARAVVNATGTWTRPFVPRYPGQELFRGRHLHTVDYRSPDEFAGQHVVVVGGGASATQLLGEISRVADTTWVTRRPPVWREGPFDEDAGRRAVAMVEEAVREGRRPGSVVGVTGLLVSTPYIADALERGVLERLPMFDRITEDGVAWADGRSVAADVILWATGFRAAVQHLAPLHLRGPGGGIRMDGTHVAGEPRIHLVGYGPSASTVGANRAGQSAARQLRRLLRPGRELPRSA
jgi:cation diffusion facilitator CzcD-associated flavoprotein CzcO